MKTTVIMLVIVLIILVLNGYVGGFIANNAEELMPHIKAAKTALNSGNVEEAARQVNQLKEKWDSKESIWEAFINHGDSEHVETLLTRLEAMAAAGTPELMLPELEELEFFFTHLTDTQKFKLENIF